MQYLSYLMRDRFFLLSPKSSWTRSCAGATRSANIYNMKNMKRTLFSRTWTRSFNLDRTPTEDLMPA